MRVLLCLSHSIEEHDQLKLLSGLGYEVASIGGYIDPAHPHDPKRPALPEVACFQGVKDAVDAFGGDDNLGAAQSRIPDAILDWLGDDGAILFHHYLDRLWGQWERLSDWKAGGSRRRVIWRTVGQSVAHNEAQAAPFREGGLEIVRYSPKERNLPGFAGEDALIRFYKDPADWHGWTGDESFVANVTQDLKGRDPWTNYGFWDDATRGLARLAAGPGSEAIGGPGQLPYDDMRELLRTARCYLYCGTQPASYTLGLLEALMTGCPVVSIGPSHMQMFEPYGPDLFEGHEIAGLWFDDPARANDQLESFLADREYAADRSAEQQARTLATFGPEPVGNAWRAFLGHP